MEKKYLDILALMKKEKREAINYNINSKILLIDGLNNYIRTWVMMPTVNEDGDHVGGIVGFLLSLGVTIRALKPTRVIMVFDGEGGSQRRKKIFPDYKGNRGGGVRLNRVFNWASDEEEARQYIFQLNRIITYLKYLPVTLISIDKIEADDTIGYISRYMCNDDVEKIYISSTDKDFYQLVNDKINIWNPVKKQIINYNDIKDKFSNITPNNFLLFKTLNGDSSDNIPGIPGLGIKTIAKRFPFITEDKIYTLNDIQTYAQDHIGASSIYKKIVDNSKQIELNYKLMTLAEGNISGNSKLKIIEKFNSTANKINFVELRKLFNQDKLWSSFTDFNTWLKTNFSYLDSFIKK